MWYIHTVEYYSVMKKERRPDTMWMKLENIMLRRQTLGDSEGQGRLAFCGPRGHKESDMT